MFRRPFKILNSQNQFSDTEVGLSHPNQSSYMKFADNGDIYIMGKSNLGIIISPSQDAIILVADTIKMLTKDGEGLKWNSKCFNFNADGFEEPTLVDPMKSPLDLYDGIDDFISE